MASPNLEGGFFLIILITAFGLMMYSFKAQNGKGMLKMLSMALFAILAVFIGSGYSVAFTEKGGSLLTYAPNGTMLSNQTKTDVQHYILPGGEDSSWYAWLFSGFAMANIMFLLKDYQGGT